MITISFTFFVSRKRDPSLPGMLISSYSNSGDGILGLSLTSTPSSLFLLLLISI
nr:MAG TPA: hypothetical protein [Caudoviricetes sp.]